MGKGIVGPFKLSVGYFAEHVHAKPSVTLLDECMTAGEMHDSRMRRHALGSRAPDQ